jgi:hypothetical protein
LYVVRAAFLASLLLGMAQYGVRVSVYLIHKQYVRIVRFGRLMGLRIVSSFERPVSPFLFVMNMGWVALDLESLYTASAPLGLG